MSPQQVERFRCWWCNRVLGMKKLHHEQKAARPVRKCCGRCARDPGGAFLLVYPGGVQEETASLLALQQEAT